MKKTEAGTVKVPVPVRSTSPVTMTEELMSPCTKAVLAILVELSDPAWVVVVGLPVRAGLARGALRESLVTSAANWS